jgi:hypothetical protein
MAFDGECQSSTPSRPLSTVKFRCLACDIFPPVTSADLENGLQKERKDEAGTEPWSCRVHQFPGLKANGRGGVIYFMYINVSELPYKHIQ